MIIFGICGKKQVGKDTFADFGCEMLSDLGIATAKSSFAGPLKQFVVDYIGVPEGLPSGTNEEKATIMGEWGDFFNKDLCNMNGSSTDQLVTVRELLQVYGTDVFRSVHQDFWVNVFKSRTKSGKFDAVYGEGEPEIVFITDVRFENEVNAVNAIGGHVVKLDRDVYSDSHKSEACVDLIPSESFFKVFTQEDLCDLDEVKTLVEKTMREIGVINGAR